MSSRVLETVLLMAIFSSRDFRRFAIASCCTLGGNRRTTSDKAFALISANVPPEACDSISDLEDQAADLAKFLDLKLENL